MEVRQRRRRCRRGRRGGHGAHMENQNSGASMPRDANGREIRIGDKLKYHEKMWGSWLGSKQIGSGQLAEDRTVEVVDFIGDQFIKVKQIWHAHHPVHVAGAMEVVDG
jgi:hypothetical protein